AALMPSPELQSPFSCTWNACSAPGLSPVSSALTCTAPPRCAKLTLPRAVLPVVGASVALALRPPPMSIEAQPATAQSAAAVISTVLMGPPFLFLSGVLGCGRFRVGFRLRGGLLGIALRRGGCTGR